LHHDGSVTLAAAVGGHRKSRDENFQGWEVEARGIEAGIADFTALIRATATALHHKEYDVCVGVVWTGEQPLWDWLSRLGGEHNAKACVAVHHVFERRGCFAEGSGLNHCPDVLMHGESQVFLVFDRTPGE
jgi:hypothetical protein